MNFKVNGIGDGGGLNIILRGTRNSGIVIQSCNFTRNWAYFWGGGMTLLQLNNTVNNTISINDCEFSHNSAKTQGGGAFSIGYLLANSNNNITIINSTFRHNNAIFGGGLHVHSTQNDDRAQDSSTMFFKNCLWYNNSAKYASAVYLNLKIWTTFNRDGNLPVPTFEDCTFIYNAYNSSTMEAVIKRSKAAFFSIGYRITFRAVRFTSRKIPRLPYILYPAQ